MDRGVRSWGDSICALAACWLRAWNAGRRRSDAVSEGYLRSPDSGEWTTRPGWKKRRLERAAAARDRLLQGVEDRIVERLGTAPPLVTLSTERASSGGGHRWRRRKTGDVQQETKKIGDVSERAVEVEKAPGHSRILGLLAKGYKVRRVQPSVVCPVLARSGSIRNCDSRLGLDCRLQLWWWHVVGFSIGGGRDSGVVPRGECVQKTNQPIGAR